MRIPNQAFIPLVLSALERGQQAKFTITGSSMVPFIFNLDTVWIQPIRDSVPVGAIVLFEYPKSVYAIHRVINRRRDQFWIRGDAQSKATGPIPLSNIYGEVIRSEHRGRIRDFRRVGWRLAGLIWAYFYRWNVFWMSLILDIRKKA